MFNVLQKTSHECFLDMFNILLQSDLCPLSVKLAHNRAKQRFLTMHKNKEATTKIEIVDFEKFSIEASPETQTLVTMCNTVTAKFNDR